MSLIDNTLAAQVPTFDPATPLAQAGQLQKQQQDMQAEKFKQNQIEMGSEMRGLQPFVNSPEFPAKWAESANRLLQRGVIDQQMHDQWANAPSPLLMKSIISKTEDPTLSLRKEEDAQAQSNADRTFAANRSDTKFSQGIALRAANRADQTPLEAAAERAKAAEAYGLKPGTPEYANFALGGAPPSDSGKPIPYETLGGTNFLVRQAGGGYTSVDPKTLGQPGGAAGVAPGASAQPAPAVPAGGPAASPVPSAGPPTTSPAGSPNGAPAPGADLNAVDPKTGRREAWLANQSPDVQAYIKKIADYEIDPRTTSIKGGHREQVLSAVAQYDPTYDQNTFGSRSKAIRDFATGPQGNSVRTFDVAMDHLEVLKKYTKALDSGDIRVMNDLRNRWLQETGSPLPTNVQAIAPIVGAEVSKAVIGSNNALADREELRKPLALANSPAQVLGAIEGYQGLMSGQLRGLKKQYEDTTGKKDFNNRIRENTRGVLLGDKTSGQGQNADAMLQHARDAISQGAPKDAVIQRLKGAGIDPSGL